jgi:amino acid adenylation domain-containing protein
MGAWCHRVGPQTNLRLAKAASDREWNLYRVEVTENETFASLRDKIATTAIERVGAGTHTVDALLTRFGSASGPEAPVVVRRDVSKLRLELNVQMAGEQAQHAVGHFQRLFDKALAQPQTRLSSINLLSEAERHWQMVTLNQTARPYPEKTVMELVDAAVARRPDHVALRCEGHTLTYRQLQHRSNALAWRLQELGVVPDQLVGIYMPVSVERIVAVLAIWKAGGAFLPLELSQPADRMAWMMEECGVRIVICTPESEVRARQAAPEATFLGVGDAERDTAPPRPPTLDRLAYIMFTSGSTGRPKGVQITHRNITNFLVSTETDLGFTQDDVSLSISPLGFDVSVCEIWNPLICGGTVVLGPSELRLGTELGAAIAAEKPTVMLATPPTWALLVQAGWMGCPTLRLMSLGDKLARELAEKLLTLCQRVYNAWGTTETTVYTTFDVVTSGTGLVPVGRPLANTTIYILGPQDQLLPVGVPGEICIGGVGNFPGYLKNEELSRKKLIRPFPDEPDNSIYRTGDLARYLPDGNIEILGRIDNQLKIRGYRVEPGEIEAVLRQHPAVADAAVVPHTFGASDVRLIGYWVPADEQNVPLQQLRDLTASQLPFHMIPARFVRIDKLPLNANGKVDRRVLSSLPLAEDEEAADHPGPQEEADGEDYEAPRTALETQIATLWQDALQVKRVGVHDDFYELGGDSLITIRLMSTLMAACGVKIPTLRFLGCLTVAQQAVLIETLQDVAAPDEERRSSPDASAPAKSEPATWRAPVTFSQQYMAYALDLAPYPDAPFMYLLRGRLDISALQSALKGVVDRHEALHSVRMERSRSARPEDASESPIAVASSHAAHAVAKGCGIGLGIGVVAQLASLMKFMARFLSWEAPVTRVVARTADVPLAILDRRDEVKAHPETSIDAVIAALANEQYEHPVDYRVGPLLNFTLLRLTDDLQVLSLQWSHVILDGWSWGIFLREMESLYNAFVNGAPETPVPPLSHELTDYVRWEREEYARMGPDATFWRDRLGEPVVNPMILSDSPYRLNRSSAVDLSNHLMDRVNAFVHREAATAGMFLVAGVAIMVHHFLGDEKVVVGLEMPNRRHPLSQDVVGNLYFTLPIAVHLTGDMTVRQVLDAVKRESEQAYDHQLAIPLSARPARAMVNYVPPFPEVRLQGVTTTPVLLPSCEEKFPFPALPYVRYGMIGTPFSLSIKFQCYGTDWAGILHWDDQVFGTQFDVRAWLETLLSHPDRPLSSLTAK